MTWLALALVIAAQQPGDCEAPFRFNKKNRALQRALTEKLENAGYAKLIERKQLAVSLVDLSQPGRRYYAGINDRTMMYAASTPKIGILLAVLDGVQSGALRWSKEMKSRLEAMIVKSSNTDASWAYDQVGPDKIEAVLRSPRYCLYDNQDGGLWVGRPYRGGSKTHRDPVAELSHGATTHQIARFYTMLDAGELVSRKWSFRMLGLMSPPRMHHKFVGALDKRAGVVFLARKSGTWRTFHSDSALIQHHGARYALVGLADSSRGEEAMRAIAQIADDLIRAGKHRGKLRSHARR